MGCLVCVCDTDQIVAAAGNGKKELQDKYISKQLERMMASEDDKKYIKIITNQEDEYAHEVISPILCEGDVIGGVILLAKEAKKKFSELEQKMASCAAGFLGRQMEQ